MKRNMHRFVLRMPDEIFSQLGNAARANNRSMNAEVVSRLEKSFRFDHDLDAGSPSAVVTANTRFAAVHQDEAQQQYLKDLISEIFRLTKRVEALEEKEAG